MTALIITHGDVDGMTCAAQLIRREHGDYRVQYSNARWIAGKLHAALKCSPARVYVTDIPADKQAVEEVRALTEAGVQVSWIDHHPWHPMVLEELQQLCEHIEYNESLATPAGVLLARWLEPGDQHCARIGGICYASEKGTPWERDWFRLLSSYVGKCADGVLERFAFDRAFTDDDLQRIEAQVALEELAGRMLADKPQTAVARGGATIAVYDISANPGIYLGSKVFAHHAVDYSLIRISVTKWQLAYRPGLADTAKPLAGCQEVSGATLSIAGRPGRLMSIEVISGSVPADIHEQVVSMLSSLL
jgi:hypothetical protein